MKTKCPVCNSCLDITWIANKRFFNCWLCQVTYDIRDREFIIVKEVILEKDMNGNDAVSKVIYEEKA